MKKRPNWDEYFFGIAWLTSLRSRDNRTKHGSVIVDWSNRILATGYNGAIEGIDDSQLTFEAPEKYKYSIHSEINALLNLTSPISKAFGNFGAKIYITGRPCLNCLQSMIQSGIREINVLDRKIPTSSIYVESPEDTMLFNFMLEQKSIVYKEHFFDPSWITENLKSVNDTFLKENNDN